MDGLTATKRIREFDAAANIIVLTSYNSEAYRNAAALAGAAAFIGKDELMKVRAYLTASGG